MQFESKIKRAYILSILLGFIPEIFVSVILAILFDGGIAGFFLAFFGLQILYILILIKNSIWQWIVFAFKGRKDLASVYLEHFISKNYPEPANRLESAQGYFVQIIENNELPVELRLNAAAEFGVIQNITSIAGIQAGMRLTLSQEDAIAMYKEKFLK